MSEKTPEAKPATAPKDPFAALKARAEALDAKLVLEIPANPERKASAMLRVDH